MDTWIWIAIIAAAAVVALVLVFGAISMAQRRRSERLQDDFGPEYDRTVDQQGGRGAAERELRNRRERVAKFSIRPLSPDERQRLSEDWTSAQARFVDDPAAAIGDADGLIQQAMRARGFPVGEFEQNAADISVEHPYVVEHYRAAHEIALANDNGNAGTEALRQAMVHYRSLFSEMVNATGAEDVSEQRDDREASAEQEGRHRAAGRLGQIQRRR